MQITEVTPDARGKIYLRTEDGTDSYVTVKEALAELNEGQMNARKAGVLEMSWGRGHGVIRYRGDRRVTLIEMDAPTEAPDDVKEWSTTATGGVLLHRFVDGRAVCNRGFRPKVWYSSVERGVVLWSRNEILAKEHADLYTFHARCLDR